MAEKRTTEADKFLAAHPEFYACQKNIDRIVAYLSKKDLDGTLANLELAFKRLKYWLVKET
jgi:hypothetical protein